MSVRASKFLPRFLTALSVAVGVIGLASYFSIASIAFRWTSPERDGPIAWIGYESGDGSLGFYYERMPKDFLDAQAKAFGKEILGMKMSRVERRWMAWFCATGRLSNLWWFRINNTTVQMSLPQATASVPTNSRTTTYPIHIKGFTIPYWFFLFSQRSTRLIASYAFEHNIAGGASPPANAWLAGTI
jgi:hypothetical protein